MRNAGTRFRCVELSFPFVIGNCGEFFSIFQNFYLCQKSHFLFLMSNPVMADPVISGNARRRTGGFLLCIATESRRLLRSCLKKRPRRCLRRNFPQSECDCCGWFPAEFAWMPRSYRQETMTVRAIGRESGKPPDATWMSRFRLGIAPGTPDPERASRSGI